jgi:hypothetical protein
MKTRHLAAAVALAAAAIHTARAAWQHYETNHRWLHAKYHEDIDALRVIYDDITEYH